jgi:ATP-dependent protease Clp ATPase subunit
MIEKLLISSNTSMIRTLRRWFTAEAVVEKSFLQKRFGVPRITKPNADKILKEVNESGHSLTPSRLCEKLDDHIVSQSLAKQTIAYAIRNKFTA